MITTPRTGHCVSSTTGLSVYYRDWGGPAVSAGGEPPVLLLHGLASTSRIYDLCAPLLASSRRVVAYDQRGHGETAKPDEGYTSATFVADGVGVAQALALEPPYVVVGHSWGATVALEWAVRFPQLVSSVVLVDGGIFPFREVPGASWETVRERLAPPDLSGLQFDTLLARLSQSLAFLDEDFRRAYLAAIMEIAADGSIRARLAREKHLQIVRTLWETEVDALFSALKRPALALLASRVPHDAEGQKMEELRTAMTARLQALQPLLSVKWLADTIHDVPLQRPALLAEEIRAFTHAQPR